MPGSTWKHITTGSGSSLAIKSDGTLWAWGYNEFGQLGDGTNTDKNIPTQVGAASDWKDVTINGYCTFALKTDGSLWAWGYNEDGNLMDGTTVNRNAPVQNAPDGMAWSVLIGGDFNLMAMKSNGSIYIMEEGIGRLTHYTIYDPVLAGSGSSQTLNNTDYAILNNNCSPIAAVQLPGNSGAVTAKVWVSNSQPAQYVKRHYEITPATNAENTSGWITLYFTNQEFKDFNSQATPPALLLPDADDPVTIDTRKANIIIEKRSGTSSDGSGLPETYTGTVQNINPEDANIVWNTDANRWEVTFAVTGFSGFFVKTQATALPVNFGPVEAFFRNGQLFVNWSTLTETNNHHFDIEISADGKTFKKTGSLLSKATGGNASTPLNYSFSLSQPEAIALAGLSLLLLAGSLLYGLNKKWRCIPVAAIMALTALIACSKNEAPVGNQAAKAFIRISQVDIDGKKSYSKTVQVEQR